jgi:hypothetical protein
LLKARLIHFACKHDEYINHIHPEDAFEIFKR